MSDPVRYSQAPVELPLDDGWLYGYVKPQGCGVCEALDQQVRAAIQRGQHRAAYEAAEEIRAHGDGHDRARTPAAGTVMD
ncbi:MULTISPECIES: hypothetical protein [unclassified Streptomyces]|uniref:hypothetical protein n=1 Tax=unclassified Streptomyces TaxID=2593676 RepID=UPI003810E40B